MAQWILHFEGRIARRAGYYILRDVSLAVMVTIIEVRIARRDGCMERYVTKSDMDHYT